MDWTGQRMTPPGASGSGSRFSKKNRHASGHHQYVSLEIDPKTLADVQRVLDDLPKAVQKRVIKDAAAYAFRPVLGSARRKCPARTKTLRKSLTLKTYTKGGKVFAVIKPDPGVRDPKTGERPSNIAHLVEYGTEPHEIELSKPAQLGKVWQGAEEEASGFYGKKWVSGTIHHPGAAAKPFLRPALLEQQANVVSRYRDRVMIGVGRETRRLAAKAAGL